MTYTLWYFKNHRVYTVNIVVEKRYTISFIFILFLKYTLNKINRTFNPRSITIPTIKNPKIIY